MCKWSMLMQKYFFDILQSPQDIQDYPPPHQQDGGHELGHEPLYAQVKKGHKRPEDDIVNPNHVMLEAGGSPQGGADSWV